MSTFPSATAMPDAYDRPGILPMVYAAAEDLLIRSPTGRWTLQHVRTYPQLYGFVEAILLALFLFVVITGCLVQQYRIPSESMYPTLQNHDRIVVVKFWYWLRPPQGGDVVVFKVPEAAHPQPGKTTYVKRIVGVSGDVVGVENEHLVVNGQVVRDHPVLSANRYTDRLVCEQQLKVYREETVADGMVYTFGDNSGNSFDSRCWGGVPYANLRGKALSRFRFWPPFDRAGILW